ncbi:MAG: hypothetical protein ACOYOT_05715 [Bacteroidales bacterium]
MKRTIKFLVLFITFTIVQVGCSGKSEEQLVKESYENYKAALLNDKGDEAIKYVDSNTIKYYTDILNFTKKLDSTNIEILSIFDKVMILTIRQTISKEDILKFDGKSLLVYGIKSGMVEKNSFVNNSIGEVIIEDGVAKGQLISNGKKTSIFLHFSKEAGTWKVDLTSLFSMFENALKKSAKESGQEENKFIFSLFEMAYGKKPDSSIWKPIK